MFKDIIVKLIQDRNITAYKLAKDTGISEALISNWKTGRQLPKYDSLNMLCDYFHVSADYLLEREQPKTALKLTNDNKFTYTLNLKEVFNQDHILTRYMSYLWEARNKTYCAHTLFYNLLQNNSDYCMPIFEYTVIFIDEALDLIYIDLDNIFNTDIRKRFKCYQNVLKDFLNDKKVLKEKEKLDKIYKETLKNGKSKKRSIMSDFRNMLTHFDHEKTNAYNDYFINNASYNVTSFKNVPFDPHASLSGEIMLSEYKKELCKEHNETFMALFNLYIDISTSYTEFLDVVLQKFFFNYTNWEDVKQNPDLTITLKENINIAEYDNSYDNNNDIKFSIKQNGQIVSDYYAFKKEVPQYLVPAAAGTGQFLDESPFEMVSLSPDEPQETSFLIRVSGDSMEPTLHDGNIVYIKQQPSVEDGDICLFRLGDQVYIKEKESNGFISHNPKYEKIIITSDDNFYCYGKVIGIRNKTK